MRYRDTLKLVQNLETAWQSALAQQCSINNNDSRCPTTQVAPVNPDSCMANGQVQFASVENFGPNESLEDAPVIVAIGANYTQNPQRVPFPTPYLGYDSNGFPRVDDSARGLSQMRRHIDLTLQTYSGNRQGWRDRHLASETHIVVPASYILIATNFCPFITYQEWQCYETAERANLLAWSGGKFIHLDQLHTALLGKVSLWIAHGIGSEVFPLFRLWQVTNKISPWLLTSNTARHFIAQPQGNGVPFHLRSRQCPP